MGAFELRRFKIAGNAGAAGVRLSYVDGTAKSVTSQPKGNYSIIVPENWTGPVRPIHPCFTFTPAKRSYTNLKSNKTGQNYQAIFNPASTCAQINVKIQTTDRGVFVLRPQTALLKRYNKLNAGPVRLNGNAQSNVRFLASQRVTSGASPAKYFEMMGLPAALTSTTYYFPAYDNVNVSAKLRIVNVGNTTAAVQVTVGESLVKNYSIPPNTSKIDEYAQNTGPLIVRSTNGVRIIASLIVVPELATGNFSEMIGQPQPQKGALTGYLFPWFDTKTFDMQQLRIGNIHSSATAKVQVTIGGKPIKNSPFSIPAHKHIRVPDPTLDPTIYSGLVKVISTNNVPIVASKRIVIKDSPDSIISFKEMMGLLITQSDTTFVFPWNGNGSTNTQLVVTNVGTSTTNVNLRIGAKKMPGSPFPLAAGKTLIKSFAINGGPVVIQSTGEPIIASMRVILPTSYSEMMGLPAKQLAKAYLFPWYDNRLGNTELRIAVP
jgi:hypothetical protein